MFASSHMKLFWTVAAATLMFSTAQIASAAGNSHGHDKAGGNGHGKNIGVGNAADGIMARIETEKHVYYTGDPLEIGLRFARGADLVTSGTVDAYLVIFSPNPAAEQDDQSDDEADDAAGDSNDAADADAGADQPVALTDAVVVPVSDTASTDSRRLFELEAVDISALPAGTYQLGLILTSPDGDPLNINDWHNGLLGLVHIVGLTVTDEAVDFDQDGDGQVDDDDDGDGFSDDDGDDDDGDDSTTTPPATGTGS